MSKSAPPRETAKTARQRAEDGKAARLAAALRDNLTRRKAQRRARGETGEPDESGEDGSA